MTQRILVAVMFNWVCSKQDSKKYMQIACNQPNSEQLDPGGTDQETFYYSFLLESS